MRSFTRIVLVAAGFLLLLIAACGKFDDPNIKDAYYLYLEDPETKQPISDQVLFTQYKNGTAMCGYAALNEADNCGSATDKQTIKCHENACYKMIEEAFKAQLEAYKAALEEAARLAEGQNVSEAPSEEPAAPVNTS